MKLSTILMLVFTLTIYADGFSQFSFKAEGKTTREVLNIIEQKSNYRFFYNDDYVNIDKVVNLEVKNKNINEVLDRLLASSDYTYKLFENNLIVISLKDNIREPELQQNVIKGTVTDEHGNPLASVTIFVKGTSTGTTTDVYGNYTIEAESPQSILVFSFIGYTTQEINVGSQTSINITLLESLTRLDEIVVTGYQSERKVDVIGAITTTKPEYIKNVPSSNPFEALQGRLSGVFIETDGTPNAKLRKIYIRGLNTLGDNSPLFIIDGVPTTSSSFQELSAKDIKSIQVLKDASASSIYGSRASNGVVIVETMSGNVGVHKIQLSSSLTIQPIQRNLLRDVCNTDELATVLWRASINDGIDPNSQAHFNYEWHNDSKGNPVLDKIIMDEWLDEETGIKLSDTDWYDRILHTGIVLSNNLSITSTTDKNSIFISLNQYDSRGIVKHTDFNRYSGRINTSTNLFKGRLKVGEELQLSKSVETPLGEGLGGEPLSLAARVSPLIPVYTTDGEFAGPVGSGFSDRDNPVLVTEIDKLDKNNYIKALGSFYGELKLIENLVVRSRFGIDYTYAHLKDIQQTYQTGFVGRNINSLSIDESHQKNWIWSNTVNYKLKVKSNSINILAGMEAIKNQNVYSAGYKESFDLQDPDFWYFSAASGSGTISGGETGYSLLSYFGKINYSFQDKYYASLTTRYDGSSRFGSNNQFGFFPALSLGWLLSNEDFVKNNLKFISFLKVRSGMGRVGNQEIGNEARFGVYITGYDLVSTGWRIYGSSYDISGQNTGILPSGFISTQTSNPNLKWETTDEINLGLDFGCLEQRITGSVDFFKRVTKNILISPPYLAVIGEGGSQYQNGATVENKGIEIELGYHTQIQNLHLDINSTLSSFHDEITYLPSSVVSSYPGNAEKTILGHSQTAIFGYIADGIFQNQGEVDAHADQPGKAVGRIRFKDINNDKKIDAYDQDWLGNGLPDFIYSLNTMLSYKNFDFSLYFQGVQGLEANNTDKTGDIVGAWIGENCNKRVLEAWTPENPNATIPAASLQNANAETRVSSYRIENFSYFKLRSMQMTYSLNTEQIKKIGIEDLQLFILGQNLFTIKSKEFSSEDPENPNPNQDWPSTPRMRTVTFGINITL